MQAQHESQTATYAFGSKLSQIDLRAAGWALSLALCCLACAVGSDQRDLVESFGPIETPDPVDEPPPDEPGADPCAGLADRALEIRQQHCAGCHDAPANQGGFDNILDEDALINGGKVVPGHPDQSQLFLRVQAGEMPPGGMGLPADVVDDLRDWIECMEAVPCTPPGFVPLDDVLETIRTDVLSDQFSADDRLTLRYFTLTQVHNGAACAESVETYRHGLSKLVNSLSRGNDVVAPVAIDEDKLIYRIDLDDYRWTADRHITGTDVWALLVASNPYAIEYIQPAAEDIKAATASAVPIIGGDWFIAGAAQAALYHEILGIPASLDELVTQLGFAGVSELEAQIDADEVIRAGFWHSGVSAQNRLIERFAQNTGGGRFLWMSYDFADEGRPGADLRDTPLGPGARPIAPASLAGLFEDPGAGLFAPDGGEAIFTLPNGLQGYMLYNADGCRLDRAPSEVVTHDAQKDSVVVNGISCMDCHDHGMIDKEDQIREYVELHSPGEFDAQILDKVRRIHPKNDEIVAQLDDDRQLFLDRLADLEVPIHVNQREPIFGAFQDFDGRVDLKRAAAELGIDGDALVVALSAVGLSQLVDGETVSRQFFQSKFAVAVDQLNIGRAIEGVPPELLPPAVPTPECVVPQPEPNPDQEPDFP